MEETNLIEEFYAKKFYFSYSSMKKLLYSPRAFYDWYIRNNKEDRIAKNLLKGKLVHCLLLEPDKFKEKFTISPENVPSDATIKFLIEIYKETKDSISDLSQLSDYKTEILNKLKEINLHQSLVDGKKKGELTGDQKRLDKICIEQNNIYFDYLCKISNNKDIIDQGMYDYAKVAVEVIRTNQHIRDVMYMDATELDNVEIFNEKMLQVESEKHPFGIKGILDRYIIDHDKKLIRLIDVKTTAKGLSGFKETVDFFDYDVQILLYISMLATEYEALNYKIEAYFVVIDENMYEYAFSIRESFLSKRVNKLFEYMDKCAHHYNNRSYRLPYAFDLKKEVLE